MDKKTIDSFNKTVKKMISLAKTLVEGQIPEIYELGHYLADNVLSKASMIILAQKNRPDLIFKNGKDGRTLDFPDLYKNMQQNYFSNIKIYNDVVKDYHADRSMYQHSFESLKMTLRQPEAENYVEFVIDLMRKTGILGTTESLPNINIMTGSLIRHDYKIEYQKEKYQEFYNLLKNPQMKDVNITLKNAVNHSLLNNLKEDLIMESHGSRGDIVLFNSDWGIDIIMGTLCLTNKNSNEQFVFTKPTNNVHVLDDFLTYFTKKVREKGVIIKE